VSAATAKPARLGLAGAAALAIAAGSLTLAAPGASAEGCAWQRHSKPVVKQVRRHGRSRRVKRVKHWWTCEAVAAALAPTPALPAAPAPATPPAEEPGPEVSHLGVKAVEWSYTLSRPEVGAGEVIVELNNQGEDAHNLKLQREGENEPLLTVPEAAAEEQTSARFTLGPGTYRLYCSLYTHEEKGMHATLVVAPG
jgi:plastocyanin